MTKTPKERQAEPDIKTAIADECDRALKELGAAPGLISQASSRERDDLYEILRKHGARSDLLKIVGSWGDTTDDLWVLNELRRWNTRDRLSEEPMVAKHEHEFMVTAVDLADEQENDAIAITLTDARGGRVRLHLRPDMAEQLRDQVSSGLERAGRRAKR